MTILCGEPWFYNFLSPSFYFAGTEPPSPTLLQRRPYKRNASLINNKMVRHITVQFLFQMAVLGYLLLGGAGHFNTVAGSKVHLTVIFNTFVFCQVSKGDACLGVPRCLLLNSELSQLVSSFKLKLLRLTASSHHHSNPPSGVQ